MRLWNGLKIGGRIRRDLAAYSVALPLLSLHRPGRLCWSWFVEFFRYRRASGCRHSLFRVTRLPGHQERLIVDLLGVGSLQFVRQHETV